MHVDFRPFPAAASDLLRGPILHGDNPMLVDLNELIDDADLLVDKA